eukprot:2974323-Heterocapsa_arctica.AAC.1
MLAADSRKARVGFCCKVPTRAPRCSEGTQLASPRGKVVWDRQSVNFRRILVTGWINIVSPRILVVVWKPLLWRKPGSLTLGG